MPRTKQELAEYQRQYRKLNRKMVTEKATNKKRQRIKDAIELLGGCCNKCKGVFDPICYDFHHVNPSEKEFTISENMLVGLERFQKEISKCILLCANCHRLEHKVE